MTTLLDLPEFKLITDAAKHLARSQGRNQLDARIFASAALSLVDRPELSLIAPPLKELELENTSCDREMPSLPDQVIPLAPMPLDPGLRGLIARHQDGGLEDLVQLVRDCLAEEESGRSDLTSPNLGSRPLDPSCLPLLRLASGIAVSRGKEEIDGATLAAACWCGHQDGMFKERPSLLAHMNAHASIFRAFLNDRPCSSRPANEPVCPSPLPLSASVGNHKPTTNDDLFELVSVATQTALFADARRKAAFHEAGHAVAFAILRPDIRITKVSIKPTLTSVGEVSIIHPGQDGHQSSTKDAIFKHVVCLLAGRAAEVAEFGSEGLNTRARVDIETATDLLWEAVTVHGFDPTFGPVSLERVMKRQFGLGRQFTDHAELCVREHLRSAQKASEAFVRRHRSQIGAVAQLLIEQLEIAEDALLTQLKTEQSRSGNVFHALTGNNTSVFARFLRYSSAHTV